MANAEESHFLLLELSLLVAGGGGKGRVADERERKDLREKGKVYVPLMSLQVSVPDNVLLLVKVQQWM